MTEHDKYYKNYMYVVTHVLALFFRLHLQKKGVSVKHTSFVNHSSSVPPVENVHNIAQNLPVADV